MPRGHARRCGVLHAGGAAAQDPWRSGRAASGGRAAWWLAAGSGIQETRKGESAAFASWPALIIAAAWSARRIAMHASPWWLAVGIGVCSAAFAGPVHRCGSGAAVRYQDAACAAGEPAVRWTGPDSAASGETAETAAVSAVAQPRPPPVSRRTRQQQPGRLVLIPLQRDPQACSRAQRARRNALQRRRRRESFVQQRHWDDRLRDACR